MTDGILELRAGELALRGLRLRLTVLAEGETLSMTGDLLRGESRPANTDFGSGTRTEYVFSAGKGLTVTLGVTAGADWFLLDGVLRNGSARSVHFAKLALEAAEPCALPGAPEDWILSGMVGDRYGASLAERTDSDNEQQKAIVLGFGAQLRDGELPEDERHTDGRWRLWEEFLLLTERSGEKGLFIAPVGRPEAYLEYACFVEDGKCFPTLECRMDHVLVRPGESRSVQDLAVFFEPFARSGPIVFNHLARTHGCRTTRPAPVGWCSWYDLWGNVDEASVLRVVETCEKRQLKPDFIQIDDGWEIMRGDWRCNEKFPRGLGEFVRRTRALGSRPGIWLCPVTALPEAPVVREHPDWFITDGSAPAPGWLDVTNPDAFRFAVDSVRQKREEGFTYFKIDFNAIHADGRFSRDPTKTTLQAYRALYAGYREAIGEESYLLGCTGLNRGTFGYVDAARVGTDSCAVWDSGFPCCVRNALRQCPIKYPLRAIYTPDPDVTYLRDPARISGRDFPALTAAERQLWHSFVGLFGGLTAVSEPIAEMEDLRELEILMPPAPEKAMPAVPGADTENRRFGMNVRRAWGEFGCWVVWNPTGEAREETLDVTQLSQLGDAFFAFSFREEKVLGILRPGDRLGVFAPHENRLLRLTPVKKGETQLIGSTLHVSMGAAETENLLVTPERVTVELNGAGAENGDLFFRVPGRVTAVRGEGVRELSFRQEGEFVRVTLLGRRRERGQSVTLEMDA